MDKRHVNEFKGPMYPDVVPNFQPEGSTREVDNFRIKRYDGSKYAIQNIKGTSNSFTLNPNYSAIGYINTGDYLFICSSNDTSPFRGSNLEWGLINIDTNEVVGAYDPLYNHQDIGASLKFQIGSDFWRDDDNNINVYWWDNNVPPKVLNMRHARYRKNIISGNLSINVGVQYMVVQGTVTYGGTDYGPNEVAGTVFTTAGAVQIYVSIGVTKVIDYYPVELIDLIPKLVTYGNIRYNRRIEGNVFNGVYFYFYQLEASDGARTSWTVGSRPINITEGLIEQFAVNASLYHEYQGMGGQAIGEDDLTNEQTGWGIRITIDDIDINYNKIRVAYIKATSNVVTEPPIVFSYEEIDGTSMDFDHIDMIGVETLTAEDIIDATSGILSNKTGGIVRKTLFLGHIRTRYMIGWDPSINATYNRIMREVLHDETNELFSPGTKNHVNNGSTLPLFGHQLYDKRTPNPGLVYNQWYRSDGGNVQETTSATNHLQDTVWHYLGTPHVDTYTGTGTAVPVIVTRKFGTNTIAVAPEQFNVYDIVDDWSDNKGATVSHYLQSLWRNENYRYGICLLDNWGNPYGVHWLADINTGSWHDSITNVHTGSDVSANNNIMVTRDSVNYWIHYMQHLGIRFDGIDFNALVTDINKRNATSLTVADLPNHFKGFMIVRAPRDASIVAQGLAYPMHKVRYGESNSIPGFESNDHYRVTPWTGDSLVDSNFNSDKGGGPFTDYTGAKGADCWWHHPNHLVTDLTYNNPPYTWIRWKNCYLYYSPDFLLNYGNDLPTVPPAANIQTVAILRDSAANRSTVVFENIIGVVNTLDWNSYSKFDLIKETETGFTASDVTARLDVTYCRVINDDEESARIGSEQEVINHRGHLRYDTQVSFKYWFTNMAVGATCHFLETKADESGSDPDWSANGLSHAGPNYMGDDETHISKIEKHLINITIEKAAPYGGSSDSAKEATSYMPVGHYQAFDADFMAYLDSAVGKTQYEADGIEVWGGDCFLQMFDYCRMMPLDNDNDTKDGLAYKLIHGDNQPYNNTVDGPWGYSHTIIFPVESNVNIGLREGRHVAKDKILGDTGDHGTGPSGIPRNIDGISSGVGQYNQIEQLLYTDAYSAQESGIPLAGHSEQDLKGNLYETRYIWTPKKGNFERIDSFRIFSEQSIKDLPGSAGPLVALKPKNGRLYYWQKDDIGYISVEERAITPNSLGDSIILGVGEVADRFDKINDVFGCQHQYGIIEGDSFFLWPDARRKAIIYMSFDGKSQEVAVKLMNFSLFNKITGAGLYNEQHLIGNGIVGGYDDEHGEYIISLLGVTDKALNKGDFAWSFDGEEMQFTGRYTYQPTLFIRGNKRLWTPVNYNIPKYGTEIFNLTAYIAYASWVREVSTIYVCILSYTSGNPATIPSLDATHWEIVGTINEIHENNVGDAGKFYGLVHKSLLKFVVNAEPDISKIFNNFRFNGTLGDFYSAIRVSTASQSGQDIDLDIISSQEYEYRDDTWLSTIPFASRGDRMVGEYMIVTLEIDNSQYVNGVRNTTISNDTVVKLTSIQTFYRKAY